MEDSTLLYWLGGLLIVSLIMTGFVIMNLDNEQEVVVDFSEVNAKLDALGAGQVALDLRVAGLETPAPVEGEEVPVAPGSYMRNQAEYENDMSEVEALKLAEESVNLDDRDFRKALFKALNLYYDGINNGDYFGCVNDSNLDCPVDDRDDITEIKYDTDVDVGDEEAKVEFDKFRVWYFIDGDEEETEKAKLKDFVVTVDDLEFNDDFEDAEVNEEYMENLAVLKVYN